MALPLQAQFASRQAGFDSRDIGMSIHHSGDMAGFLSRLQMQHSVSMSVGSSSRGSQSALSYQNNFFLPISNRIRLAGSVSIVQPTFSGGLYARLPGQFSQTSIYYDTQVQFDLGENTKLNIGLSNIPRYYVPGYAAPGYFNGLQYYGAPGLWQINE